MGTNSWRLIFVCVAAGLYVLSTLFPQVHDALVALAGLVVGALLPGPGSKAPKRLELS